MPTIVPLLVDGDDFTDDFTIAVKSAVDELQDHRGTTGAITFATGITLASASMIGRLPLDDDGYTGLVVVALQLVNNTGGAFVNGQTVATLASGYRPAGTHRQAGYNVSTGQSNVMMTITTSGLIQAAVGGGWLSPGNTQSFGFSTTFLTTNA